MPRQPKQKKEIRVAKTNLPTDLLEFIPKHPYRKFCFEKFKKLFLDFNWVKNTEYDIIKKALNIERSIFNYSIDVYKTNCKES
jgi:hypothetical protein